MMTIYATLMLQSKVQMGALSKVSQRHKTKVIGRLTMMGRGCIQAGVVLTRGVPYEPSESAVFDEDLSSQYWCV